MATLVGRERERRYIDAAIAGARRGNPSAIAVVGEPGIGKSALLADTRARHPDANVIAVVGVEAEQSIPFAALSMMLTRLDDVLARPEASAAAYLRDLCGGTSTAPLPDVALSLVTLLAALADDGLVLVLLDDVHWFDAASLAVIEFALRRLGHLPVAIVAASRRRDVLDLPGTNVQLGPLDCESAQRLLELDGVAPDVSRRCWDICGGNPLILVELGQSLTADQRTGARPLPEQLPVPGRLERWLADRIAGLPEPTRISLATLALAGTIPLPVLLETLLDLGLDRRDLDVAEVAGVVVTRNASPTFTHPLFATMAGSAVDLGTRRRIHRVLATKLSDSSTDRRAWHLVEACETPDDVAHALDGLRALAERATEHGGHLAAAEAWERLASLVVDPDERARALIAAGRASWDAGRPDLAVRLLREARDLVPAGAVRAAATEVLGLTVGWSSSVTDARRLLEAEVAHVESDHPGLAVNLLVASATLASLAASPDAVALTERAERIAERGNDYARLAAGTIGTHVRLVAGEGSSLESRLAELDSLIGLIRDGVDRSLIELAHLLAFGLMVRERWHAASDAYEKVIAAARASSLGGVEMFGLAMSAEIAWRTGRWSQARGQAACDAAFHARLAGLHGTHGDATLARVEAALGMNAGAREHAYRAVQRGDELEMHSMSAWGRHALGLADLAVGDPSSAVVHLGWIWDFVRTSGATDPGLLWWQGDLLESLLELGRRDDARRLVDELEAQATATGRRWPAAIAARGRGALEGDELELARSIAILDELDAPFESARSRLLLASCVHDDDAAHAHLERARTEFERLGARPWVERCLVAAGSSVDGERVMRPALAARLTPAELRVATAVGAGMTNREAASALVLSTRTIDAHLRSIFRKLDIGSRSQLAVLVSTSMRVTRGGSSGLS